MSDDASLIVSELMTTALKATGAPPTAPASHLKNEPHLIHLGIYGHGRSVTVQVWDNSPERPIRGHSDPEEQAEGRRAKAIIEALALHAGHFFPKAGGKVAWAELAMDTSAPLLANHDREVISNVLLPHSYPRLLIRLLSGPLDL
ncbi:ATP-binding protein [Streptomyces sp. SID9124]|uniref:ATP-binding protein n=1 Tax=Streptomyces sp. SID9124 TaxID=2706108 RepID=UPI0013DEC476|nr:ATP-binding protein [Streptomyces sp. SID9124]NED14375.1 ATP-binding protein [Streptomyces sp. SID9124]